MVEWNIQSRAHACQGCGRLFVDQQTYHTALFDEGAGYERRDFCEACWNGQAKQMTARREFVSHWQGVFEIPAPQPELIRKETAETLLRKLVERDDRRYQAAVFILAVMLERKRILKVKDQVERNGRRFFLYEQPKTGDAFSIADPGLSLNELDQVQRDVASLLESGLPEPSVDTVVAGTSGAAAELSVAAARATPVGVVPEAGGQLTPAS